MTYFAAGMLVGGGLTYAGLSTTRALSQVVNEGINNTYRCDRLLEDAGARIAAQRLLEKFLVGKVETDLLETLEATDLKSLDTTTNGKGYISAGATIEGVTPFALEIEMNEGMVVGIAELPGEQPCPLARERN